MDADPYCAYCVNSTISLFDLGAHHSFRPLFLRFRFDPVWVLGDEDDEGFDPVRSGHAAHEAGYSAEAKLLELSHFDGVWVGDADSHPLPLVLDGKWLYDNEKTWETEVAFPDSASMRGPCSTTKISIPEWYRSGRMQEDGSILWEALGKGSTPRPIDAAGLRWVRPFDGRWETSEGKIGSIFGYHLTKGDGSRRLALDYHYAEGKWTIQFDGNGPKGLRRGELVGMDDGKKAIKWEATDKVPKGDPFSIWVWAPLSGEGMPKSGGLCDGPACAPGGGGLCEPASPAKAKAGSDSA